MTKEKFYTDYATAINWLSPNLILCNNIVNIDESIWNNAEFSTYDEEADEYRDIYQYYLTNLNQNDVEWLNKTFNGLLFTYSDLLECFVLCVDHYGTPWNGVPVEVISQDWIELNKDKEYQL